MAFPNPAAAIVSVQFDATTTGPADCTILSATGAVVRRLQVAALTGRNLFTADVAGLAPGNYVVCISSGGTVQTTKFMK